MQKIKIYPKIGLLISGFIVIPVGILYGFYPEFILESDVFSVTESNFHKAVMGLYLSFGIYWISCCFKNAYFKTALTTNMLFMFGLFFGRIGSFYSDGLPSNLFVFGCIGELFLAVYSAILLKKGIY